MKAVRIHAFGGPDVLVVEDAPRPKPQAGDVLIEVRAAGVNPVDWKIRQGTLETMVPHSLPLIPGWDVAGVVVAKGRGVQRLQVGDEVFGLLDLSRDGAYAEYVVAPEAAIALKPRSQDHAHAAATPMAALAAWQALFDAGGLKAGQRVLIHGAAGGVGSFAVQLAKDCGAHVIGTAAEHNHPYLRELGADEIIDYRATRFETVVRDVDLVLDTIGRDTLTRSWGVLKPGGILVSIAAPPSPEEAVQRGVRQAYVVAIPMAAELVEIAALIDAGRLRAVVDTVLPLTHARRAQVLVQTGHLMHGKIVLRVSGR